MSGSIVDFPSNGKTGSGYLSVPASGSGPGVIVLQEWWGLVDHIKDVADRFAAEGFVALAPDMYHGESATSPDDAGKLMMGARHRAGREGPAGRHRRAAGARYGDERAYRDRRVLHGGAALAVCGLRERVGRRLCRVLRYPPEREAERSGARGAGARFLCRAGRVRPACRRASARSGPQGGREDGPTSRSSRGRTTPSSTTPAPRSTTRRTPPPAGRGFSPFSASMSDSGFLGWLSRLRSWQLFVVAGVLFVVDVLVPDPVPFIDEVIGCGLATLMMARWKGRRE